MRYISFCSGIEAATAAWHPLGWKPVAFCEIDRFPSKVLAHHYPNVPNLGDFTKVDWSQYSADICVGGTPCQAFSVAGLRNSLADERGNLTLEFVRAINTIRPHTVVWENVPGVLSTADNAFGCFLAALVGCDEPIVFEHGWPNAGVVDGPDRRAAWRVLDAQYFGLAQRRKRVFVVANSGDRPHPAEILLEWESLRRDSPPSREKGEGTAGTIAARTKGGGGLGTDFECTGGTVAMCLNAGGMRRIDAESETFVTHALTKRYDSSEDGCGRVTPLVPVGIHGDIAHTLNAHQAGSVQEDGTGHGVPVVAFSRKDHGADAGELAPTLRSMTHDGSHANGGGQVAVAMAVHGTQDPCVSDIGFALGRNNGQENAVTTLAIRGRGDSSELEIRTDGTANALLTPDGGRAGIGVGAIHQAMAVRRLLPVECERLMGFRDNYTLIPGYDLNRTGEFGGNRGLADGPRYRSLGNSMAVPCMSWIGRRIQEAYSR